MAFADPLPLTIGGSLKNLVRIDSGKYMSEYLLSEATQEYRAVIRSQDLKEEVDGRRKVRHNISVTWTVFATATTSVLTRTASMSITHYKGDDATLFDDVAIANAGLITVTNVGKLNNYES